jgi:predicted GNAT family acetyltransferase
MSTVVDNRQKNRFELEENGLVAFANYHRRGSTLVVSHVESPPPLRGKGTAARLMGGIVAIARAQGEKITPLCSYAALWFRRHPGEADLVS